MNIDSQKLSIMEKEAERIFRAGLAAVDPEEAVSRFCRVEGERLSVGDGADRLSFDLNHFKKIVVVGAGKAAAPMAAALEKLLGRRLSGGIINVKYGHTRPLTTIRIIEAGHPLPDEKGAEGARQILDRVRRAGAHDLIICLISGGGSALLPLPAEGISLADKRKTMSVLLKCGASITEINTLRKHLSAVKGGQLARAAAPATMIALVISDVVGNDLSTIASGPTVADDGTFAECRRIIEKYRLRSGLPGSVERRIEAGISGATAETPKSGDPAFDHTHTLICADNMHSILAARDQARDLGYTPLILSSLMEGETREIARAHTAIAREVLLSGNPVAPPACLLSGGETTVTIRGTGKGGRNQEFCLAAAADIKGINDMVILSGGTDGTDGPTDAAGAVIHAGILEKAAALGLDPQAYLDNNDAYNFFRQSKGLLMTGPTLTNVMDLRILLIGRR